MFKTALYVKPDSDDTSILDEFDNIVKQEVPKAVRAAFGRAGIPYCYIISTLGLALNTVRMFMNLLFAFAARRYCSESNTV